MTIIRDDFAGPGGWDEGLRLLDVENVKMIGIEFDQAACDTARAAGHLRYHGDVRKQRTLNPDFDGYIASPPCQTFSAAGKGKGRAAFDHLVQAARFVAYDGMTPEDAIAKVNDDQLDERSVLVLEPLHVVATRRPRWVALEQVPTVLPIWEAYVEILALLGYRARAGNLHAEQYGVPQTRKRAILVAVRQDVYDAHHLTEVPWPTPTHSKFYPRNPQRLDEGVLPWVSMAEALGYKERDEGRWQAVEGDSSWVYNRPSPTIVGSFAPDVVAAPGYRKAGDPPRQKTPGSVRITVEQAGVLQSFPVDYPWQGTRTKQFQQVGNAIPPLLAAAILVNLVNL